MQSQVVYGSDSEPAKVQVPSHVVKEAEASAQLAEGQALLIDPYLTHTVEVQSEASVPMLKKLPYVGRGFRNKSVARVERNIMVLLKPTIQ